MKLKYLILIFIVFNFSIEFSNCECYVNVETSAERRPVFQKHVGTHIVKIEEAHSEFIKMYDGEKITGHCATKFDMISSQLSKTRDIQDGGATNAIQRIANSLNKHHHVYLYCGTGTLYMGHTIGQHEINATAIFSCEPVEWGIYETKSPLPWCSTESVSYIFATINFTPVHILAAMCYNLKSHTLESLRYNTHNFSAPEANRQMPFPTDVNPQLLNIKVNFEDFLTDQDEDIANYIKTASSNKLLNIASYIDHSIMQTEIPNDLFNQYEKVLKISWWKNLYHTNWQHFLKAFDQMRTRKAYDVFLGMSGKLLIPEPILCDGKESGEMRFKQYAGNIPAYIWTYVRAIDDSEEFVFISYNSPFSEFFNATDIIFCRDICHEISWLSKVRSTFRYSTMGISFCCSIKSVQNSTNLIGFPRLYKDDETKATTLATATPITTTTTTTTTEATKAQEYEEGEETLPAEDSAQYQVY